MASVDSWAAEMQFKALCKKRGIKLVAISAKVLPQGLRFVGKRKLENAFRHLRLAHPSGQFPAGEVLDLVFSLDAVIQYRGQVIGVDVTMDPSQVAAKEEKLRSLAKAHAAIGIQRSVTYCSTIESFDEWLLRL